MQKILNSGVYYNRTSGRCPYGSDGGTKPCYFTSTGLTDTAKNMIEKAKWYTAGPTGHGTASVFFGYERSTQVYNSFYPQNWIGEVGLIYPSDYGYASGTSSCLSTNLFSYQTSCKSTNWLFNNQMYFTITPATGRNTKMYAVTPLGNTNQKASTDQTSYIRPSVYLKTGVLYTGGNGSSSNPYQIAL